jgi:hypothetical protein
MLDMAGVRAGRSLNDLLAATCRPTCAPAPRR